MKTTPFAGAHGRAILATMVALLACSSSPSEEDGSTDTGFPLAYFHDDCAPWDGRALTLVLSDAEMSGAYDAVYPNLRISSYRPPESLEGATLEWAGDAQDDGYAALCTSAESCERAARVRVRFDRSLDDPDRLTGTVRVALEGGRVVSGPFEARRVPFTALCG